MQMHTDNAENASGSADKFWVVFSMLLQYVTAKLFWPSQKSLPSLLYDMAQIHPSM